MFKDEPSIGCLCSLMVVNQERSVVCDNQQKSRRDKKEKRKNRSKEEKEKLERRSSKEGRRQQNHVNNIIDQKLPNIIETRLKLTRD
jgi:hypothetical protein